MWKTGYTRPDCPEAFDIHTMTAEEYSDFVQCKLITLDIYTTDIHQSEEVERVGQEESITESGFTSRDRWIVCPHYIPWIILHPCSLNLIHPILLNWKTISQSYILTLILLPLIPDASWSGNDNSLSAMSLQWLPVRGCLTWMLQFRPLTLVRSTQSLPCSVWVRQVSSLTQSLCDIIAWSCDCWHRLFLCTMQMELPMSREPFTMSSMWYCNIKILSKPSLQLLDWERARRFLASAGSVSTIQKSIGPQVKWKWVAAPPDVALVRMKLHRICKGNFQIPIFWLCDSATHATLCDFCNSVWSSA